MGRALCETHRITTAPTMGFASARPILRPCSGPCPARHNRCNTPARISPFPHRPAVVRARRPVTAAPFTIAERFRKLAPRYDVVLCDIWGVVHDGVVAFEEARDALARFRRDGGTVILVTNAPRPSEWVARQLDWPTFPPMPMTASRRRETSPHRGRGPRRACSTSGRNGIFDLSRPRHAVRRGGGGRLRRLLRPVRRCDGDAGRLSRGDRDHAPARAVHAVRQP